MCYSIPCVIITIIIPVFLESGGNKKRVFFRWMIESKSMIYCSMSGRKFGPPKTTLFGHCVYIAINGREIDV